MLNFRACLYSTTSTSSLRISQQADVTSAQLSTAFSGPTARISLLVTLEGWGFQTRLTSALVPLLLQAPCD